MPAKIEEAILEAANTIAQAKEVQHYAEGDSAGAAPTVVILTAAFAAPATLGKGWLGVYKDTHTGGKTYMILCDGTTFTTIQGTAGV